MISFILAVLLFRSLLRPSGILSIGQKVAELSVNDKNKGRVAQIAVDVKYPRQNGVLGSRSMMGYQKHERELFSYAVNLEKRVRSDHPLRRVAAAIDFSFVRGGGGSLLREQGERLGRSRSDPEDDVPALL